MSRLRFCAGIGTLGSAVKRCSIGALVISLELAVHCSLMMPNAEGRSVIPLLTNIQMSLVGLGPQPQTPTP